VRNSKDLIREIKEVQMEVCLIRFRIPIKTLGKLLPNCLKCRSNMSSLMIAQLMRILIPCLNAEQNLAELQILKGISLTFTITNMTICQTPIRLPIEEMEFRILRVLNHLKASSIGTPPILKIHYSIETFKILYIYL